ncbi:Imm64 family immunity protein [Paenibacillus chitinolyticus]|uniref:Imm64 family immunity protein n=1 Tax=Paenibacillus chitinolyticus TaxID=79263 RepID=UPI00386B173E
MGSYINVGLVYSSTEANEAHLKKLIELLIENEGRIENVKFCEDVDGERWVQYDFPHNDPAIFEKLTRSYYGHIDLFADLVPFKGLNVEIEIEKCEGYSGFLVSFRESEMLPDYSEESLETATETVVKLVAEIYPALQFDYAFCDLEAHIEFSPREFKPERYSLAFWPDLSNGELKVTRSSWHINGLTERQE